MSKSTARRKPAAQAPVDYGAPTKERRQKGEIIENRAPGSVVRLAQPPIARYLKRDLISPKQYAAGLKLVEDYELGVLGARDPEAHGSSGPPTPISEAQIMALTSYRLAMKALGVRLVPAITSVCIDERHTGDLAPLLGYTPAGMMDILRLGLNILSDHYELS